MASLHLFVPLILEFLGISLGATLFLVFINDLPDKVLSRIGIYAHDSFDKSVFFFAKVESAGELELDLWNIVECGDRWFVTFNVTKTGACVSLLLNPSCICINLQFGHAWSTLPISGVVLQCPMFLIC